MSSTVRVQGVLKPKGFETLRTYTSLRPVHGTPLYHVGVNLSAVAWMVSFVEPYIPDPARMDFEERCGTVVSAAETPYTSKRLLRPKICTVITTIRARIAVDAGNRALAASPHGAAK